MKIYKTQKEVEKDIKNDVLEIEGDVTFECLVSISASIKVTGNINARNINAWDINARDINARNIIYYAFCNAYNSIKCKSWKAKREKFQEPICLDGKLEVISEEKTLVGKEVKVTIGNDTYTAHITKKS